VFNAWFSGLMSCAQRVCGMVFLLYCQVTVSVLQLGLLASSKSVAQLVGQLLGAVLAPVAYMLIWGTGGARRYMQLLLIQFRYRTTYLKSTCDTHADDQRSVSVPWLSWAQE
jgi:hypothetical protein